jgi:DNA-binding NtrC family response regulator
MNQLLDTPRPEEQVSPRSLARKTVVTKRILVADDDEGIRHIISFVLAGAGFEVNAASDGEQAWEALHHEHYDLLVTDVEMPRLGGIKLIERIRKEGMSLPVIIASGTFPVERVGNDPQLQIAAVIPKPFDILELLDTVRHALQASSGTAAADHGAFHQLHANPQPIR